MNPEALMNALREYVEKVDETQIPFEMANMMCILEEISRATEPRQLIVHLVEINEYTERWFKIWIEGEEYGENGFIVRFKYIGRVAELDLDLLYKEGKVVYHYKDEGERTIIEIPGSLDEVRKYVVAILYFLIRSLNFVHFYDREKAVMLSRLVWEK
jgi:hypothetical protein